MESDKIIATITTTFPLIPLALACFSAQTIRSLPLLQQLLTLGHIVIKICIRVILVLKLLGCFLHISILSRLDLDLLHIFVIGGV